VAGELNGLRVAFLTANEGVEQVELTTPWQAVTDAGGTPELLPSVQTDIRNAGGTWTDTEVQVCHSAPNVLVSSRKPDDLPAFCAELISVFQKEAQPA
jgi:protease I